MKMIVVSYDIVDDRRRSKVAKVLLDYGTRVQYSVFEVEDACYLDDIKKKLSALIDKDEDSIYYYQLCGGCEKRKIITGKKKAMLENDAKYRII